MRRFVIALVLLALQSQAAWAWWDDNWAFRKPLTLDTTSTGAAVNASLVDTAVLIRLDVGNFGYFADAQADGADIRFIAGDDKTPLAFHVESWDAALGMAFVWVKVPVLAPGTSETIHLYYGNPKARAASDPGATYDVNQVLSHHFAAVPSADATSYANQFAEFGALANPSSVIGAGVRFDGAEGLQMPASATVRYLPERGLTLSAWVNMSAPAEGDAVLVELVDPSGSFIRLGVDGLAPYLRIGNGATTVETARNASLLAGSWRQLAAVIGQEQAMLYLDGREVARLDGKFTETGGVLTVGATAAGGNFLRASLDELSIANTARSADWVSLQYANQGQQDQLIRYGEDTAKDADGNEPSYFLITLQNVTLDGWVVIGVLAIMFVASWIIMITKALTIRRVRAGNQAFLADFRHGSDGAARLPDAPGGQQASTIWQLYAAGHRQIQQRVAGAEGGSRTATMSPQALDAIRATIDATNVRETQKLNSQMVLLTLAIAGGPFLGLLGTVVGVMITFAAIAATGDVNVNSIAPGIAAALVATVAGLGVAIPALFGYNWLAAQIKEIVADNRVFIDEFVTRVAERYS